MDGLWERLHDLFEENDGSLPEISVAFEQRSPVPQAYALIADRGTLYNAATRTFWSETSSSEVLVASVPNPAQLVITGEAQPFHVVFQGIRSSAGALVPDLGLYVFQQDLAFDYRMGPEWGPASLLGLFELLADVADLAPGTRVFIERGDWPEVEARFQACWSHYIEERAMQRGTGRP